MTTGKSLFELALSCSRKPAGTGYYIVEGLRAVRQVLDLGLRPKIIVSSTFASGNKDFLSQFKHDEYLTVKDKMFSRIADTRTPQGIAAVMQQKHYSFDAICAESPVFYLDHLKDPGNLGTIFRTAEAFGIRGILLSGDSVFVYNPKIVRASLGSIESVPFHYLENCNSGILQLKESGFSLAAMVQQDGIPLWSAKIPLKTAFCIGNEAHGLCDDVAGQCRLRLTIPMTGRMESLNAASAAAIVAYEMSRRNSGNHETL
ncbi:MAG: RNA methyltransferase [Candidatus Wallbacteria bacterium]|nr:RNA methyltransferase [Candidatus Wallbacteria bacterium]